MPNTETAVKPNLIDGKAIAAEIRSEVALETATWVDRGHRAPYLAAVLVGDDPASGSYVRGKAKACAEAGIGSDTITFPSDVTQDELLAEVNRLNDDPKVNGILVQLPLPDQIDEKTIINAIDPAKDVDGFHPVNAGLLVIGDQSAFVPATPAGIIELLKRSGVETTGAKAVVLGRSNIVGKPMANLLIQKGIDATVTVCHSRTKNLESVCRDADILVAAIGRPHFVTADMVKPGATIIDVGINRVDDPSRKRGYRLVGDVDFANVQPLAGRITPVPGGVGPMTIAILLRNTLDAAKRQSGDA
ncbi:MAG: bifunctional methylenetetrahydrofolate dehydrogenase/methenyltetrahydrofolate cyclohydrolase FolD [Rhodothermales bacterium]|nr:bifunctional methylenetetrahydrofolate dehydrogenase/methenyltetrahydrofolate cyclohydrolase FolD [Rhodothermales bacterium]